MKKHFVPSLFVFPLSMLCAMFFNETVAAGWQAGFTLWPVTFGLMCLWDIVPDPVFATEPLYSEQEMAEIDDEVVKSQLRYALKLQPN